VIATQKGEKIIAIKNDSPRDDHSILPSVSLAPSSSSALKIEFEIDLRKTIIDLPIVPDTIKAAKTYQKFSMPNDVKAVILIVIRIIKDKEL
tara:strand:+ start:667 stop:942 length:276 start_codon:yes stop_codon:yes gene_type:complete